MVLFVQSQRHQIGSLARTTFGRKSYTTREGKKNRDNERKFKGMKEKVLLQNRNERMGQ